MSVLSNTPPLHDLAQQNSQTTMLITLKAHSLEIGFDLHE